MCQVRRLLGSSGPTVLHVQAAPEAAELERTAAQQVHMSSYTGLLSNFSLCGPLRTSQDRAHVLFDQQNLTVA